MAVEKLELGDTVTGLLIDGVDGTPYAGATLRVTEDLGVVVEVPYIRGDPTGQFAHVEEWFSGEKPPANLILLAHEGAISLFDVRWNGHSIKYGGLSIGNLAPREAVLGWRMGELSEPLAVTALASKMDALGHWIGGSAVEAVPTTDDKGRVQSVAYNVGTHEVARWTQGDATMTLTAAWRIDHTYGGAGGRVVIHDDFQLESSFPDRRPVHDHLREHRLLARLLVFLYGRPLSFRQHSLTDDQFALLDPDGEVLSNPAVEVISKETVRERVAAPLSEADLGFPIAYFPQINADGLRTWATAHSKWARFLLPASALLGRERPLAEDVVISSSIAIEAAGAIIGVRDGEEATYHRKHPTTKTYVFRCLSVLQVGWGDYVANDLGLATAIANNYNDLKHADRGDLPPIEQTFLVGEISKLLIRLIALHITEAAEAVLHHYREGQDLWPIQRQFEGFGLRIRGDGTWESSRRQ